ncbi:MULTISPECIES: glycerate kinase [unclassified Actinopolyspora]|uniref:glycerate kinase n=1 Tax=unclassified Actinopolyspora TaxID=2639451 RepID=UPI0013F5B434|nr:MULTISPECIES: glycerate kinase [unclassified Actinopolyspora]NHD15860.1 glycerate kinase [Actinopolyspora sp. BKK2]NHE74926.1 glycerate kinase [Actinopolyspora sp. BKK1]
MRVVAAPDKFRGSASARDVAAAVASAATARGAECVELPMADGGEGTLEAFGGANRRTTVTGPLHGNVAAGWRLTTDGRAVVEMATASGLALAGGPEHNAPEEATTRGTGELIATALRAGAGRVLVGLGGSATTDGGLGAVEALEDFAPLDGRAGHPEVLLCCDVDTVFTEAAAVFGPQKGANALQRARLTERLERLAAHYRDRFGVDVTGLAGSGAAGGLAGGLAALGARPVSGFGTIAEELGLGTALDSADLVVTGEGKLDPESFTGKVVGGVTRAAEERGVDVLAVVGTADPAASGRIEVRDLSAEFGRAESFSNTTECVRQSLAEHLAHRRRD